MKPRDETREEHPNLRINLTEFRALDRGSDRRGSDRRWQR